MKKQLILLSTLFLLGGCSEAKVDPESKPLETKDDQVVVLYGEKHPSVYKGTTNEGQVTYLMMSPFGYLDLPGAPVKGQFDELFYENTIEWHADINTDLPDATVVKSTVDGATFRGWAYYDEDNENVFPDYYTKVPAKAGLALKAIFDGTDAGGGGGTTPTDTITYTITDFADWVPNDGAKVFVWSWGGGSGDGVWSSVQLSYQGEEKAYHDVTGTFTAPNNITGFNIVRCSSSTTLPNWKATGDSEGRVYNKTANVDVRSGVTSYTAPEFVQYEYHE